VPEIIKASLLFDKLNFENTGQVTGSCFWATLYSMAKALTMAFVKIISRGRCYYNNDGVFEIMYNSK